MWFKARKRRREAAEHLADAMERGAPESERQAIIDAHIRDEEQAGGIPSGRVLNASADLSGEGVLEGRVITRDNHETIG